ncbi:methyl-CpG-binding domain protein 1 isoform X3 [Catharus ustulatus]|uniref:methyl-CpG-binding domain protein 1 isoform X3 n=1 Tax=Catharus ustulatus TaxID=91951 RepID=UPI00140CD3C9|nr:methyl-CpG-binding domain protein 1 isoform X3 [Catharus ustulatus]
MGTPQRRMAEGWAECPALGPGWQRREAFRKSGATSGRSDTYYRSPTGQKFRSKIELRRFLGPGHDLSNFDFKSGLQRPSHTRTKKAPKWHLPTVPLPEPPKIFKKEEMEVVGGAETVKAPPLSHEAPPSSFPALPIPIQATPLSLEATPPSDPTLRRTRKRPPLEPPQDGVVALCASCHTLFPGVSLPPQRRCRWLCPDCRAQRRDFNREQRFYKRVGCGSCQACRIPEDCGICSACARNPPGAPAGPGRAPKCLLRRCLRIVKKGLGCGSCSGCLSTEDCGSCCICLRRLQPGLKRQWRCLRRRCLRPKKARAAKKSQSPLPLTEKWKPPMEREPSDASSSRHRKILTKGKEKKKPGRPPKPPGPRGRGVRSRASRRCGVCAACRRPADCGRCDFCRDKPKFGGQNLKRQKCRWRQCLRCAMDKEELLGGAENSPGPLPGPPLRLCPIKEEAGPLPRLEVRPPGRLGPSLDTWDPPVTPPAPQDPRLGLLIASAPRLKGAPPEPSAAPQRPPPGDLGVLIAATPRVKQEQPQPSASLVPVPPSAPLVVLDESEEEEEEEEEEGGNRVPFPLPPAPQLWPGSFLEELAEIPLPAHWGVVGADGGPGPCPARGLRLVQRCPRSSMAAAAVLLNPGLAFRVLVARGRPVPPGHEVLARRPPLRSVLDLVELLCDLEAYGPCPGPPGPPGRPPAPRCHVLVRGGRSCRPCQLLAGEGH